MLGSLDGVAANVLIEDATNALFVAPGSLIYGRSGNLYSWQFDPDSRKLEGETAPVVPEKLSYWEPKNFIPFAASDDGTIVYLPDAVRSTEMRWYDRGGRQLGTLGPPGFYVTPRISPDGRRVAYMRQDSSQAPADVWIRDLEFERASRLTQQSGTYFQPVWAPDADRIAFICQSRGVPDLCITSVSGGGEVSPLYESSTWKTNGSWHPDGTRLLFTRQDPETNNDIMILPAGSSEPAVLLRTSFSEDYPEIAPDGRRMAYISDQTGRDEVYVRNLDGTPGQWQISTEGGVQARWRADGKELIYASSDGYVMVVPIQTGAAFRPGTPVRLFQMPERPETSATIFEDATPDGERLLLNVPTASRTSIGFHAIFNWPALLNEGGG
jgi:Tol biopolymer transport system component